METNKTIADFKKAITDNKVTGYIWMVEKVKDVPNPLIYNNEEVIYDELNKTGHLHNKIQEAYLYDGTNSIHIKNIDGEEKVFIHKIADYTKDNGYKNKLLNLPSHIITNKNLDFLQVYKLTPSTISNGFETWQPIVRLFKGFSNQPTKKD